MPYALFSNEAKLSKAYPPKPMSGRSPRRAASWSMWCPRRRRSHPAAVLDYDYEIKFCQAEPHEDPARNKADAEREAMTELQLAS